ncbi:MAG: regulatory signaling modulator protein AmpE [Woeseiaceae bacterium]
MNLIALILGLLVERLATKLFHLRRLPWLDRLIDAGLRQVQRLGTWPPIIPVILLALALVLPIAVISLTIGDRALGLPYVAFAVFVLFFSFGPKDIGEDVDEYCTALEDGDKERIEETAQAIVEGDVPDDELQCIRKVEEAIYVHANNRLFAVIFWFIVLGLFGPLGPLGAWAYRVTDLIRRRAVATLGVDEGADSTAALLKNAALLLHGWLAWVPARLSALGYAAAGHFDAALGAWRAPSEQQDASLPEYNDNLLARVGVAAQALADDDDESLIDRGVRGATAANGLVFRSLMIWAVIIAAMTLYGFSQ